MGIEGGDDDDKFLDPEDLFCRGGEEEESFGEFWVADGDGDGGVEDGDDFGECDDEEDGGEGDDTAGPLEAFVLEGASLVDDLGFGLEGLEGE